jgi:hypothetical protein
MNCQSSTMPQGIPGEAGEGQAWSIRRPGKNSRQTQLISFLKGVKPQSLGKNRFLDFLHPRPQRFVALKEANAGVPAQNSIVVAGRSQALRFLE